MCSHDTWVVTSCRTAAGTDLHGHAWEHQEGFSLQSCRDFLVLLHAHLTPPTQPQLCLRPSSRMTRAVTSEREGYSASLQMEEQEVEVTEAEVLQLLQQAAFQSHGFEAHAKPAGDRAASTSVQTQLESIATPLALLLMQAAPQKSG